MDGILKMAQDKAWGYHPCQTSLILCGYYAQGFHPTETAPELRTKQ